MSTRKKRADAGIPRKGDSLRDAALKYFAECDKQGRVLFLHDLVVIDKFCESPKPNAPASLTEPSVVEDSGRGAGEGAQ